MENNPWDLDDDAVEWAKTHTNYVSRGRWETITVAFEHRRDYVTLNRTEWNLLQEFLSDHELSTIKLEDFKDYPRKVKLLILDWMKYQC